MKALPQISTSELEVMNVLWKHGSLTSSQIVEYVSKNNDWKAKTIHTLINRLVSKGAVVAEKLNSRSNIYTASVKEDEYKYNAAEMFVQKMYNGSINMMLTGFIKENKLTEGEIEELKKILEGE